MTELKAYLLCRFASSSGIYTSWSEACSVPTVVVDEFLPEWPVPDDAGILITHMHYRWEDLALLRRVYEQNRVPILILSDGILEYRNTWEHPDLVDGSIFQPVFGHKLACIGRGQARIIESWGNVGKCEVVGLPRLDAMIDQPPSPVQTTGPFRLLIATANTPAFNDQQRQLVIQSLRSLQTKLAAAGSVRGRPLELIWRLSDGLEVELGMEPNDPEGQAPLSQVLDQVDAVITTPSTMYLESVLRDRPTAILDFHNSPHYVTPAWLISADSQIDSVVSELADPPTHKMLFQATVLDDQLECHTPAKPRMLELIDDLLAARRVSLEERQPLRIAHRILADPQHGFCRVPAEFDLGTLYENDRVFREQEVSRLQVELAAAIARLEQMPLELAEKSQYITQLMQTADRARMRIENMHNRIVALRTRFGVVPGKPPVEGRDVLTDDAEREESTNPGR